MSKASFVNITNRSIKIRIIRQLKSIVNRL